MTSRAFLSIVLLVAGTSVSGAQDRAAADAACKPDVRRYCHRLQAGAGDDAFLQCLQAHRPRLTGKCRRILEQNGV